MDVTSDEDVKVTDYVTDTKYIVPESMRPRDTIPHVFPLVGGSCPSGRFNG